MNALTEHIKTKNRPVYMPYLTIGDPDFKSTVEYAIAMIDAGADIIELGIPFSDPTADGPIIQAAMVRALKNKDFSLKNVFSVAREIHLKRPRIPLIFLTYLNPVLTYCSEVNSSKSKLKNRNAQASKEANGWRKSVEIFLDDCKKSGIMGVVIPDLPFEEEEAEYFRTICNKNGIGSVMMIAPNTGEERFEKICRLSSGFIYYVTSLGVTGERKELPKDIVTRVKRVQKLSKLPVLAGFGINTPDQVKELKGIVDGVIVGSLNHRIIERCKTTAADELKKVTSEFVKALA